MNDAEVKLQVKLDDSTAEKSVNNLTKKTESLEKSFASAGKKLTVGLTLPIAGLIASGVKYNSKMETFMANLTTLLGSQEKAAKKLDEIKEMASKTPFETSDLLDATQMMLSFGLESDKTGGYLQTLGDISMGNSEKMSSLTRAFSQMGASGKASMEDINQMVDAGFNPLLYISGQTGESMADLRDRVSQGKVSFEEIAGAMKYATSEGKPFYKAMDNASETTEGKMSTLKDSFDSATGSLTENLLPMFTKVVDKLTEFSNWLGSLNEDQQDFILKILGVVAVVGPLLLLFSKVIGVINLLTKANWQLIGSMLASPITWIIVGIVALIAIIVLLVKNWDTVKEIASNVINAIVDGLVWLGGKILDILNSIGGFIVGIANWIINTFVGAFNAIVNGAKWLWNTIVGFVTEIGTAIGNAIWGTIKGIINGILWLVESIINGFIRSINNVISIINKIPGVNIGLIGRLNIPRLAVGTNYVAGDGLAYLHEGEAVVPKKYNPAMGFGNGMQTITVQMPDIYIDSDKIGRAITPSISKTLRLAGAR